MAIASNGVSTKILASSILFIARYIGNNYFISGERKMALLYPQTTSHFQISNHNYYLVFTFYIHYCAQSSWYTDKNIWSAYTKPGKWAAMYLCVRGIDFTSFYDFDIWFSNCLSVVFLFCFSFYVNLISRPTNKYIFYVSPTEKGIGCQISPFTM